LKVYLITSGEYEQRNTWAAAVSLDAAVKHIKEQYDYEGMTWEGPRPDPGNEWELKGTRDPSVRVPYWNYYDIKEVELIGAES